MMQGAPSPGPLSSSRQRAAWARSEMGDLFVYRVMSALWPHLTTQTEGLARNCGGVGPSKRPIPTNALPQPEGGKFEIDFHRGIVSEPSWLEGAELFGPPGALNSNKRGGATPQACSQAPGASKGFSRGRGALEAYCLLSVRVPCLPWAVAAVAAARTATTRRSRAPAKDVPIDGSHWTLR